MPSRNYSLYHIIYRWLIKHSYCCLTQLANPSSPSTLAHSPTNFHVSQAKGFIHVVVTRHKQQLKNRPHKNTQITREKQKASSKKTQMHWSASRRCGCNSICMCSNRTYHVQCFTENQKGKFSGKSY